MDSEQNRRWKWLAIWVAAVVALATTVWFGRPFYRHFKERRSQAQAEAFLARGDFGSALLSARQTLELNPTNVPACRVMAALADGSHNPVVLDFWHRIVLAEPTVENKLQLASAALRYENPPYPLTAQILDELAPAATNLATFHVIAAGLALGLHRLDDAETHFAAAAKLDPTNQLYALNLAVVQLGSTNAVKAIPARATLENLRTDPNFGAPALRALVVERLAHRDIAAANGYSTQLLASAKATLADQLQQLGILRQLGSEDFFTRVQAVQRHAATNVIMVAQMAEWMQANDLVVEELFWLTNLPPAIQSQNVFRLALADAYMQKTNWLSLRDFVSKGDWDDMEFLRLALLSQCWSQLNLPQLAESNWESAISQAGSRYGALTALQGLADRWKIPHEREDLLRRIVERYPRGPWSQRALEPLYMAEGNTAGLNRLYAKLFSVFPGDIGLKNNLAFTSLLLKTNLPQACRWAEEVYTTNTNSPVAASTYAFALQLQGRAKDGLAVMQKLDPRFLQQPDTALYYGILLTATGATNDAAPFLKIASAKTGWLPEEMALLAAAGN